MANKRISKEDLSRLIREKAADQNLSAREAARQILQQTKCGLSLKYVASVISMERGTHKKPRENFQAFTPKAGAAPRTDRARLDAEIEKLVRESPDKNAIAIATEILDKMPDTQYHLHYVANLVRDYKKSNRIETAIKIKPVPGGERYQVIDGTYKWEATRGPIELPVELADQMFYEYSRHGLDMSQSQMRQKHDLKIWQWNSIKNTLFLYKDSNILSPHTEDNTPPEQFQQVVDDKMQMKMKDKQRLIESSYFKETIKRYKETIQKDSVQTFALENMIDELNDITADWKSKTATLTRTRDFKTERKWIVAVIADLHIGARSENLDLTPDYSPAQTRNLLSKIADRINKTGATDVTVCILGDIIESFTGLNHPNSWQSVEFGMHGAKVIKEAMSVLEEFLAKTNNVRQILAVSGNHDRITASKKEDSRGQVAEIILYMLQRLYGKNLDIQYNDIVLSKQVDGIQYILAHGDKKAIRDGKQAVINHGDSKLFNVILEAHVHNRQIKEDEKSHRRITAPAVFTGNRYSEENGWLARPGFLTFENDGTGRPTMTDHTIG